MVLKQIGSRLTAVSAGLRTLTLPAYNAVTAKLLNKNRILSIKNKEVTISDLFSLFIDFFNLYKICISGFTCNISTGDDDLISLSKRQNIRRSILGNVEQNVN